MALLTALRLFASGAYDAELSQQHHWLEQLALTLAGHPVQCRLILSSDQQSLPTLEITLDEAALGRSAFDVCRSLRNGTPGVYVGHWGLEQRQLIVNPLHLNEADTKTLARRLAEELQPHTVRPAQTS